MSTQRPKSQGREYGRRNYVDNTGTHGFEPAIVVELLFLRHNDITILDVVQKLHDSFPEAEFTWLDNRFDPQIKTIFKPNS